MSTFENLFPPAGALADAAVDERVARFAAGLAAGEATELPDAAGRIRQAREKLAAGGPLRRWGELVTIAQFGPAEIGRAVARFCDEGEPGSATCAGLWTAVFLCDSLRDVRRHRDLVPDDLLRRNGAERDELSASRASPGLRAAFVEMAGRAADTLPAAAHVKRISHPGLRRHAGRQALITARLLRRLGRADPLAAEIGPTRSDRWLADIALLLQRTAPA